MKKKLSIYTIIGSFFLSLSTSCTDLSETVYDQILAEDFGKTKGEINALMGTAYNSLKTYWSDRFFYLSESGGSMAVTPTRTGGDWYDSGKHRELYMHAWTAQNGMIKDSWKAASDAIGVCNGTIATLEISEALNEDERKKAIAEMRGLRAFWQYVMMDAWGNVPIVEELDPERNLPETKSRQENFDWILKELNEIKDLVPDEVTFANYGKFTRGVAYTLFAKMYLNAAAWGVTVDGNAYELALAACDEVLSLGYQLEQQWETNFQINNEVSTEAIFAICFSAGDTKNNNQMMNRTLHYNDKFSDGANYGSWNGVCAQPDYVRLFYYEDGSVDPRLEKTFRIGQRYDRETGEMIYTNEQRPLNYTIDIEFSNEDGYDRTNWRQVYQDCGARCQKWPYAVGLTDAMENDFHIFRLADIYLMKAELLVRLGKELETAKNLVNDIRRRAYGGVLQPGEGYDSVDEKKIQLERRLELAWEGWSRQDDIRFGDFEKAMWPQSDCERYTGEHLKLYPVSQDAWQANSKLKQNPGYPAFSN